MATWVSKRGEWHPALEKVSLKNITDKPKEINGQTVNPGEPYIYEGPDRAALYELFEQKVSKLGNEFFTDPDLISRVRQLGYKDVKEYANLMGYDEAKSDADFKEKAKVVTKHEIAKTVKEINTLGGGRDFSGQGNDVRGGFGDHN
jgi:hypothetical protein